MPITIDGIKNSIEQLKSINVGTLLGRAVTVIAENRFPTIIAGTLIYTSPLSVVVTVAAVSAVIFYASNRVSTPNPVKAPLYEDSLDPRELGRRMTEVILGLGVGILANPPPIVTAVIALATVIFYGFRASFGKNPTPAPIFGELVKPENLTSIFPGKGTDIVLLIFEKFKLKEIGLLSQVSKSWNQLANDHYLTKRLVINEFAFHPLLWNEYLRDGMITKKEVEMAFRSLPNNILAILTSPSKGFPGKRLMNKHILTWMPTNNDKELTINSFGELLKDKEEFSKNQNGYYYIYAGIYDQLGDKPIKPGWVLFPTDILRGSREKRYSIQKEMVNELNGNHQTDWKVPKTAEAIFSMYAYYFRTGERLFTEVYQDTSTRCQESIDTYFKVVMVGNFIDSGLQVKGSPSGHDYYSIGVAPSWKFEAIKG